LISSARRKLRNEVRRELDALEAAPEHCRRRLDGQGLRKAGNALDQQMSACDETDEHALQHLVLTGDHALDLDERLLQLPATSNGNGRRWNLGR